MNKHKGMMTSQKSDWITPPELIDSVLQVMGMIDLDPCSPLVLAPVPAKMYYTEWSNGLEQNWYGRVYMNPPYGKEIKKWIEKVIYEYNIGNVTEAIVLVPARTDTRWFALLTKYPWCAIQGRLKFSGHNHSAPFPSAIFYLGQNTEKFVKVFSEWGTVWRRYK